MEIRKAAGIIIKDGQLLLFKGKNKDTFVAPGGKPEGRETLEEALARELQEELGIEIEKDNIETFGTFSAEAATNPGNIVTMTVFLIKSYQGEIQAKEEGSEIIWATSNFLPGIKIGSIFAHEVLPRLKELGMID